MKYDIFLSYASSDRARVVPFAEMLEAQGWSVWWDQDIPHGKTYDEFIQQNLEASRVVVVIWSKESVGSRWVRTEASEGMRTNTLVPVKIDAVTPPLAFRLLQTADLTGWHPGESSEEMEKFRNSILALLKKPPIPGGMPPVRTEPPVRLAPMPLVKKTLLWVMGVLAICLIVWGSLGFLKGRNSPSTSNTVMPGETEALEVLGGKTKAYQTVEVDGSIWLAENLNLDIGEGTWFYQNDPKIGEENGRLYTWEAALKACSALGEGWRLPTHEEWISLTRPFGGPDDFSSDGGKGAYEAFLNGTDTLRIQFSGWRNPDGGFLGFSTDVLFWTSTSWEAETAVSFRFDSNRKILDIGPDFKSLGLSCRCISYKK